MKEIPWRCPSCRSAGVMAGGVFQCTRGHHFGLVEGVSTFCPVDNYANSFGSEWLRYQQTQVDSRNGTTISRDRFFEYTGWPRDLSGQSVLEVGCGSGRFTEVLLAAGANVVSFDYSAAVVANLANNGTHPRLTLFRGDVFSIPIAEGTFDRVACIGVLQHTPDPERAFHAIARMVAPGGVLAVDVYRLGIEAMLHPKYRLRALSRWLGRERLARVFAPWVPELMAAKKALRRIPGLGIGLAHTLVPVADYRDRLPLTEEQAVEWAQLTMVDWLTPEHDHPQTRRAVTRWAHHAGLVDVQVLTVSKGWQLVVRGRRPS